MRRPGTGKADETGRTAERVKREFIDQGHMGRSSGQGFYTYE